MLRLVEAEGKVNNKGCIELPAAVLEHAGIMTEDRIKLVYIAYGESLENSSKEFVLARPGTDNVEEDCGQNAPLQIPQELLADAGIPLDADLDIVCREQKIIILPAEPVPEAALPKELLELCRELGISDDKVNIILKTMDENCEENENEKGSL